MDINEPYVAIPDYVLYADISSEALRVWAICVDIQNRQNGKCYLSQVVESSGLRLSQVFAAYSELEEAGLRIGGVI